MRNFDEMKALVLELVGGDFEAPKNVDMDCFIMVRAQNYVL